MYLLGYSWYYQLKRMHIDCRHSRQIVLFYFFSDPKIKKIHFDGCVNRRLPFVTHHHLLMYLCDCWKKYSILSREIVCNFVAFLIFVAQTFLAVWPQFWKKGLLLSFRNMRGEFYWIDNCPFHRWSPVDCHAAALRVFCVFSIPIYALFV